MSSSGKSITFVSQDETDRELDWLLSKETEQNDGRLEGPEDEIPPRPAMGDFYGQDDDMDDDIYNFRDSDSDDEKLRTVGYDPEELERQGKKEEILESIISGKERCDENRRIPYVDVRERVRQLNAEMAENPDDVPERKRTIKFKENLVELEVPPDDDVAEDEPVPEVQTKDEQNNENYSHDYKHAETHAPPPHNHSDQQQSEEDSKQNGVKSSSKSADSDSWNSGDSEDELNDRNKLLARLKQDRQIRFEEEERDAPRYDPFAVKQEVDAPEIEDDDEVVNTHSTSRDDPFASSNGRRARQDSSSGSDRNEYSSDEKIEDSGDEKIKARRNEKSTDSSDERNIESSSDSSGKEFARDNDNDLDIHSNKISEKDSNRSENDETRKNNESTDSQTKDKKKFLIELDGKFELISSDDVRAKEMGLPALINEDDQINQEEDKIEEEKKQPVPHPPSAPRPRSAVESGSDRESSKPKRSWSARPSNEKDWNIDDYHSPYALSDAQKRELARRRKLKEERDRENKRKKQREQEAYLQEKEEEFMAWLKKKRQQKRHDQREQKERDKMEKQRKEEEEKEWKENHPNAVEHKAWVKKKKKSRSSERSRERERQQAESEAVYIRSREECQRAFKKWLREKSAERRKQQKALADSTRIQMLAQRRCRKSQQLANAMRQAQAFRYVDYYGYRF